MKLKSDLLLDYGENLMEVGDSNRIVQSFNGVTETKVELQSEKAARKLNKAKGKYFAYEGNLNKTFSQRLAYGIEELLDNTYGRVLVVGLGNDRFLTDSLGPKVLDSLMYEKNNDYEIYKLYPICSGETGISSQDILEFAIKKYKPQIVVAIDSIVTNKFDRLGRCAQITDTGIAPGGGLREKVYKIDSKLCNAKVVGIGIPLILNTSGIIKNSTNQSVYLTHYQVDKIISECVNCISQALKICFYK